MKKIAVTLVLTLFALSACGQNKDKGKSSQTGTTKAELNLKLQTIEGRTVTLKDYLGKVVILDIWDTWCPPCRMEIPHFIDLYSTYKSKGLEIIGAAIGREGKEAVAKFIKDNGVNYTNVFVTQELLNAYGPVQGIPTTMVLDQKGVVYKKYVGYQSREVFEADIKALLSLNKKGQI